MKLHHLLATIMAVTFSANISHSQVISTFNSNAEGWLSVTLAYPDPGAPPPILNTFTPTWTATGGNPGGYVTILDPDGSGTTGNTQYWSAPAPFLGNQSTAYGHVLSFDLADTSGGFPPFDQEDIILVGNSLTLAYDLPTSPGGTWTHFEVPLNETGWRINSLTGTPATQTDMQTVLAGISSLYIRGEYQLGPDTQSLDNVQIVPEPSSVLLLNISTRLNVETGENVLIGGFIVVGTDPKKVIIRAIGPSLLDFGVAGALADPILELHKPDSSIVTNDNWRDTQEQEIIDSTIPPTNNLESSIVDTLDPGAYTAIVKGKNDGTGVGLVEVYDLDQAANSHLANISTRGFVDIDDNAMIGGFIVGGAGSTTVLVRAIGPSLAAIGIADPLLNPTLELHDASGTQIAFDDDWQDTQQAEIEATTIPPTDDLEAAIVMDLSPAAYTAVVRGKNNTTGVGLMEVYNLQ